MVARAPYSSPRSSRASSRVLAQGASSYSERARSPRSTSRFRLRTCWLAPPSWPLIALQLLSRSASDMGFGAVFMLISSAVPSKRPLGATNGLAQTVVSIRRALGPAPAVSLFALSLQNNILDGHLAYVVLLSFVGVAPCATIQLPRDT
ncbi:hypothetical protein EDB84DRAFT_1542586 [Lactarius hengduanensis]|nr:hypothetical protein EDB84DRAFT_1542586 [Lactarius hengduanensis]